MNRNLLLFVVLMLLFNSAFGISSEGFEHRVILLGNSITVGKQSYDGRGFRDELYYKLKDIGFPFRFVGSTGSQPFVGHFQSARVIGDFYVGRGGNGSFDVGPDMRNFKPTIAVIHLGSNDFWLGGQVSPYSDNGGETFNKSVSGRLGHLIEYLLQWRDGTRGEDLQKIFVCKIIPKRSKHSVQIAEFNQAVGQMVDAANRGELATIPPGVLKLVDQYSTFDITTMLSVDGTHPNQKGYRHMASVFFDAFLTLPLYMKPADELVFSEYPGRMVGDTIKVSIVDGFEKGVEDTPVYFRIQSGDGQILGERNVLTDSSGIAVLDSVYMGWADSTVIIASSPGLIDSTVAFTLKPRSYRKIAGDIVYFSSGIPVSSVNILCNQSFEKKVKSGNDGYYTLNIPVEEDSVVIKPEKEKSYFSVTAYDAALAARHALGVDTLGPVAAIAADVDGDSLVTINDALVILNHVVGVDTVNNHIGEWAFKPDEIKLHSLSFDTTAETIYAAIKGDVHGGWGDNSGCSELYKVVLGRPVNMHPEDGIYRLPVYLEGGNILSAQLDILYDKAVAKNISVKTSLTGTSMSVSKREGKIFAGLIFNGKNKQDLNSAVCEIQIKADKFDGTWISIEKATVNGINSEITQNSTGVQQLSSSIKEFAVLPAYPNPFNSSCSIKFSIDKPAEINAKVFDIKGRQVAALFNGFVLQGMHTVLWNGETGSGSPAVSGTYFIRIEMNKHAYVKKVQLVR